MKHLVFIINPKSGVDRQKAIQQAIDEHLDLKKYSYEIQHTAFAKHGTELAKTAAHNKAFAVVAVGGDGSVNDIVKGLYGTATALAIIPKGSGNGMARTMEIPLAEKEAIEVINNGKIGTMDIGFANDQPFVSNAGVGFDALISKKFSASKRRGLIVYSWLVTKYLWLYKAWEWRITIDDKAQKTKAFIINIANGKQFGYDFKIAPDANYTDGLLDVVIVKKFPKWLGFMLALRLKNGSINNSPFVKHYRAKEIIITHPQLTLMQLDGDAHAANNTVHFRVEANALKVIVP